MAKILIKIEDLFSRLNLNNDLIGNVEDNISPINIKVKSITNKFVPISNLIRKRVDSYKIKLSDGYEFIASDSHILNTSNGNKKICDMTNSDYLKDNIFINSISFHKKDDILYDISIPYPHLYKDINDIIHHNSNILTYIWKILNENKIISNVILVVPTINLVTQFKSDLIEYGIDENIIGEVYGNVKEWNKSIVISTWQTLVNNLDKLELFDSIFVDEVHLCKSASLTAILQECSHMLYKIGCTGTLPNNRLENLNIKSYLGPVVADFPVSYLVDRGYLSECNVNIYDLYYKNKIEGNYNEVKDIAFAKTFRLETITDIVKSIKDENVLLLVNKISKEGDILENYLRSCPELEDRQIKFIYSKTKPAEREEWRQKCIKENNIILIAVFALFQQGINIINLNHIVLASSSKSKIRTLQSIGRSLRKGVKGQAYIYDLVDHSNKFLPKHAKERIKYYEDADFNIKHIELKET